MKRKRRWGTWGWWIQICESGIRGLRLSAAYETFLIIMKLVIGFRSEDGYLSLRIATNTIIF